MIPPADEILISWYEGKAVDGARYVLNTPVTILEGEYVGKNGSIISLESLQPQVIYYVEAFDGGAALIQEAHLEPAT
jgi:hypothetical protein